MGGVGGKCGGVSVSARRMGVPHVTGRCGSTGTARRAASPAVAHRAAPVPLRQPLADAGLAKHVAAAQRGGAVAAVAGHRLQADEAAGGLGGVRAGARRAAGAARGGRAAAAAAGAAREGRAAASAARGGRAAAGAAEAARACGPCSVQAARGRLGGPRGRAMQRGRGSWGKQRAPRARAPAATGCVGGQDSPASSSDSVARSTTSRGGAGCGGAPRLAPPRRPRRGATSGAGGGAPSSPSPSPASAITARRPSRLPLHACDGSGSGVAVLGHALANCDLAVKVRWLGRIALKGRWHVSTGRARTASREPGGCRPRGGRHSAPRALPRAATARQAPPTLPHSGRRPARRGAMLACKGLPLTL